ncbi:tRNA uridine-5-carboxymethylaminomethyl(34) synthesis enzyme MnmG [Carboxylicivirga marina]|uniref:tRNA uridine 5-carboxymethylaminomethyl modification enzyme MnmG n=1 Tax=Carboxylicivirga marina TaxID=2800988 RepID=A0ABS1HG27_9BACT|nr:tRNA uridine-5-carboxymethylaminomethyl(34) synthesis enzyme MnmG [Carboxylicivirga marina]MBK3516596.1 tRNA uridine-5-carboxymethylaminomethyl(34) synthesis enzyme MnmG [Carboxylicivirga marina]
MDFKYDVIVVGGGHAGCEAAAAAANLGSKVLLITMDMGRFAQMSCNPAIGGVAKGQIVREIDALGGYTGIITDKSSIQFRMLNRSKGPAMWSPRAQCDRMVFSSEWRIQLEKIPNVFFWQDSVVEFIFQDNIIKGVRTSNNVEFLSEAVVLTTGTFLNGLMHIGSVTSEGGRVSEPASKGLSEQLLSRGFTVGRMKTGTPVRIDERSINFDKLDEQKGDGHDYRFSYLPSPDNGLRKRSCFITYTNPEVHKVLETGLDESPMYNGTIQSIGPRYCPSIETKIVTFSERERHQLFLEPEGETTIEYYLNGFSSSLPLKTQIDALKLVPGLEEVKVFRPGYAIEYDFFEPTQLKHTLETKKISNLFFAGQINGTTGYEEAAAQGLIAGINAHQKINNKTDFTLSRDEAYIGVLIDDLVTKGVDEPYRMFTSRAEFRILLRQDDADSRLSPKSFAIGLASQKRIDHLNEKIDKRNQIIEFLKEFSVKPALINSWLEYMGTAPLKQGVKLIDIISRPQINIYDLLDGIKPFAEFIEKLNMARKDEILESTEIILKYSGYINRERLLADKFKRLENLNIVNKFDYKSIKSLSTEARQKLDSIQPETIGQASRISGVSPSDINVLLVLMGR